eukprot:1888939-Lingulodinium_polyedra.AAC.1
MGRPRPAGPPTTGPVPRPPGPPAPRVHELRRDGDALSRDACARRTRRGKWASLAYSARTAAGDDAPEPGHWR